MNQMKRIIIVGGGSLAKELISWMIDSNEISFDQDNIFFIDDNLKNDFYISKLKIKYLSNINDCEPRNDDIFYLGISNPEKKSEIVKGLLKKRAIFSKFIHPSVIISSTSKIGNGTLIFPYSICSYESVIGDFVTINLHSAIGHNVLVNSYSTISSFVDLTGNVVLGERVMVGSGARFLPSVKIGDSSKVGAGAIVMRSIPRGKTAYCQPAKLI